MRRTPLQTALVYAAVFVFVITTLAPVVWLAIMSVSSNNDLTSLPLRWIPHRIDFSRYVRILTPTPNSPGEAFLYAFRNSLGAAGGATIISLLVGIPAAYSFSRFPQRYRSSLLYVALATYMLPPVAIVLPVYIALGRLHLLNHVSGLVIVYCTILLPFMTWLLKSNIDAVPAEIEQAAAIDGARLWRIIWHITLPLAKAGVATSALFGLLMAWDEFFYALLYTSNVHSQTLTVAIADFASGRATDYPLISAAGLLASVPPVVIAFFLQKSLVQGLASGGVKG
jgi:multiple sugar transport system permease protein